MQVQEAGGTEVRKGVHVSALEQHELPGSKGTANFILKFDKGSKSTASISIVDSKDLKGVLRGLTAEDADAGKFVPVAALECRGLEPIGYTPESDWMVEAANSQTKWDDVDLSEGEWTEYDEKAGEGVGVYKIRSDFKVHRP
ncbi:hypothetical protein DUNSADRAFT_18628 [Dunaliella salina]|uniref:Uncharacterized protein n=1 Tax=Dunaliella salina TaxID=3046 RepID=A0ABQ7FZR4_DUNSA|nr:hypothetical protein DUNSADRAFT_18628 [Dunaliella salina]|eukprot:KAF5827838.1 hypothetical protein DUNSADRAFT_18628 [Dunaliella salina]